MASRNRRSPRAPKSYTAARTAVFDLTRATQQTAILMALALGCRRGGNRIRPIATRSTLGYLRTAPFRTLLSHPDPQDLTGRDYRSPRRPPPELRRYWQGFVDGRRRPKLFSPVLVDASQAELDLDIVMSPIDGAEALSVGRSGSLSVMAGGRPGCFLPEFSDARTKQAMSEFFILVARRGISSALRGRQLKPGHAVGEDLAKLLATREWFRSLGRRLASANSMPTVGVTFEGPRSNTSWDLIIPHEFPKRSRLDGSTVAAAITALLRRQGIDIAVMFARRSHAVLIAAATKALGGQMLAVPIRGKKGGRVETTTDTVLDQDYFVRNENVFVVATGVSTSRVLGGVVFDEDGNIRTHSLCLSCRTQARRDIRHSFDLTNAWFRFGATRTGRPREIPATVAVPIVQRWIASV